MALEKRFCMVGNGRNCITFQLASVSFSKAKVLRMRSGMAITEHRAQVIRPTLPEGAIRECSNALVRLNVTVNERGTVSRADFLRF